MQQGFTEIITPEGVILEFETAGIGSRTAAIIIDTIILGLVSLLVITPLLINYYYVEQDAAIVIVITLTAFVNLGYFTLFELLLRGQTPGKRLLKIRVVKTNGSPASAGAIIMRNLLRIIDQLPAFYMVGITAVFFNPQERRIGDLVAGTMVVKEFRRKPFEAPAQSAHSPVMDNILSPHEILTLQSFFQREKELGNVRRAQILAEYLEYFKTKYDIYPKEGEHTTTFLKSLL
ncbi:MAG: RDD family protein, partial [Peptococcaceae bacterium]|nr:RDD family protein [Peptococcaceae bacterium]